MNICVIASDNWVQYHLSRWIRFIRMNVKQPKLYLWLLGDGISQRNPLLREFEKVKYENADCVNRNWLNSARMSATTTFGVDEILYLDCDCDVMQEISDIPERWKKPLGCVKSPLIHKAWAEVSQEMYGTLPSREFNNGLLYMRKDFGEEYRVAWDEVAKCKGVPERIQGTLAFNAMLHNLGDNWDSIDYEYGVIWHDVESLVAARIVQFCNDEGQRKRVTLEQEWRAARE